MITFKQDLEKVDNSSIEYPDEKGCPLVTVVANRLDLKTSAASEYLRVALANALLMDRKQQDYGSRNMSDFGLFGCVVKMNDKMQRLKHLMASGRKRKAQNESIADSLRDLSNFAIIGLIIDMGRWPDE